MTVQVMIAAIAVSSFVYLWGVTPSEAAARSAWGRVFPAPPWRTRSLSWLAAHRGRWPGLGAQVQLELTVVGLAPARYLLQMIAFATFGVVAGAFDVSWWAAPIGAALGLGIRRYFLGRRYKMWLRRCGGQVSDLATLLKARMQAGETVVPAMFGVRPLLMDPFGYEWQQVLNALESGIALRDALATLKRRLPDGDIASVLNQLIVYDRDGIPQDPFGTLSGHLNNMRLLKRDFAVRRATGSTALYEGLAFIGAALSIGVPLVYLFWTHSMLSGVL